MLVDQPCSYINQPCNKNDAMAIRKRLLAKKQQLCTAAPAASAFGGSA